MVAPLIEARHVKKYFSVAAGKNHAVDDVTFTIQKDPELLTAKCVRMIKAVVEGTQPVINDLSTYNNGKITVPSYLCTPLIIDKDNLSLLK